MVGIETLGRMDDLRKLRVPRVDRAGRTTAELRDDKNHNTWSVPINSKYIQYQVNEYLRRWPTWRIESEFLLCQRGGGQAKSPSIARDVTRAFREVRAAQFTGHDLRRSMATFLHCAGVEDLEIDRLGRWAPQGTRLAVYTLSTPRTSPFDVMREYFNIVQQPRS